MTRSETQVSKAHPAIKKIIAAITTPVQAYGAWRGRIVSVVQVDPGFTYHLYNDTGEPSVFRVSATGRLIERVPRPAYGGSATVVEAPYGGEVIVVRQIGATGRITIYVPELDTTTLDVARDALLASDKKKSAQVLKALSPYDGIASAILESQSKTLEQVTSGKRSRQLDREIAEFLRAKG